MGQDPTDRGGQHMLYAIQGCDHKLSTRQGAKFELVNRRIALYFATGESVAINKKNKFFGEIT